MNRRQLLANLCVIGGCAGIAGMLVNQEGAGPASRPGKPVSGKDPFNPEEAKRVVQALEAAGFKPREAMFWDKTAEGLIRCTLCPTFCTLRPYERGRCRVRISLGNRLETFVYGKPCSVNIDPIEKKPVFHLVPGSTAFSIATAGCLLGCRYCQNWQISQKNPEECDAYDLPPEKIVSEALENQCRSVAYTYTEPTIFYEYMYDTAKLAKEKNLFNVMVSCGYINQEPLKQLLPRLDVLKVDLKGFTEKFYRTTCGGSLEPVLKTLETAAKSTVLIDIVTLVVPTLNDDLETMRAMFRWIAEKLGGGKVTLFLSRFHPTFQLKNLPPTPVSTMETLRNEAIAAGLKYVYLGNVPGSEGENTYCPNCRKLLVGRMGYSLTAMEIKGGTCSSCQTPIPGIWE